MNTYLISVRPKWANLFFDRATPKTVELRKGNFGRSLSMGDRLLIYSTLPVGKIIGEVAVRDRQELPISELRIATKDWAQVSPDDFNAYYESSYTGVIWVDRSRLLRDTGIAVWVDRPELFENPIALATLKIAGINPPQQLVKLAEKQANILFPRRNQIH